MSYQVRKHFLYMECAAALATVVLLSNPKMVMNVLASGRNLQAVQTSASATVKTYASDPSAASTDETLVEASAYSKGQTFTTADGQIRYLKGIDSWAVDSILNAKKKGYSDYVLTSGEHYYRVSNGDYTKVLEYASKADAMEGNVAKVTAVHEAGTVSSDVTAMVKKADSSFMAKVNEAGLAVYYDVNMDAIDSILSSTITSGMTDQEKVTAINNYLCDTITYDETGEKHSCADAIFKGSAVCQGYSNAFYLLMNAAGVPTDYISGETADGSHGWNRVQIGGQYYYVDVTWNDATDNSYLLLTQAQMNKDHVEEGINQQVYMY